MTQEYTFDQLIRLEKAVQLLITGRIHKKLFIDALVKKYDEGGVGLDRKTAQKMADVSITIVKQAEDVRRFRSDNESDAAFFSQHKFAERVREYLLTHHHVQLTKAMQANLTTIIADRLAGIHGVTEFHALLQTSIKEGGLGLGESISDDMARYMEKLIALGVDVSYKA